MKLFKLLKAYAYAIAYTNYSYEEERLTKAVLETLD